MPAFVGIEQPSDFGVSGVEFIDTRKLEICPVQIRGKNCVSALPGSCAEQSNGRTSALRWSNDQPHSAYGHQLTGNAP